MLILLLLLSFLIFVLLYYLIHQIDILLLLLFRFLIFFFSISFFSFFCLSSVFLVLGFGQPDVFYPKNLLGSWNVAQTYTDIIGENKNLYITEMLSKKILSQENEKVEEKEKENGKGKAVIVPYTIQYQCNFIDIKGNIVRDRSFCETNKFNALLSSQEKEIEKGRRISALGTWDYSNPNILSIQLSNGMV